MEGDSSDTLAVSGKPRACVSMDITPYVFEKYSLFGSMSDSLNFKSQFKI